MKGTSLTISVSPKISGMSSFPAGYNYIAVIDPYPGSHDTELDFDEVYKHYKDCIIIDYL